MAKLTQLKASMIHLQNLYYQEYNNITSLDILEQYVVCYQSYLESLFCSGIIYDKDGNHWTLFGHIFCTDEKYKKNVIDTWILILNSICNDISQDDNNISLLPIYDLDHLILLVNFTKIWLTDYNKNDVNTNKKVVFLLMHVLTHAWGLINIPWSRGELNDSKIVYTCFSEVIHCVAETMIDIQTNKNITKNSSY